MNMVHAVTGTDDQLFGVGISREQAVPDSSGSLSSDGDFSVSPEASEKNM